MVRVRAGWWWCGLVVLAACDGGLKTAREQDDPCVDDPVTLRVEVVDAQGQAVSDAVVMAVNEDSGRSITGTTGERGVTTSVNEDIGAGPVQLVATAGSKVSPPALVSWTCDGCHCNPDPVSVQLQLRP